MPWGFKRWMGKGTPKMQYHLMDHSGLTRSKVWADELLSPRTGRYYRITHKFSGNVVEGYLDHVFEDVSYTGVDVFGVRVDGYIFDKDGVFVACVPVGNQHPYKWEYLSSIPPFDPRYGGKDPHKKHSKHK